MSDYQKVVKLWQDFNIQTEADLAVYLDSFRILFAYNSNKIENDNTTYEDTYEIFDKDKVSNYTGDTRTLIEIQNQKRAYLRTLKAYASREPITEQLVRELQLVITDGTYDEIRLEKGEKPGQYKKHHYVVGISETGAAPETVQEEIVELIEDVEGSTVSGNSILTAAAYFHAKVENIHPFSEGNGRTGRTLMNYCLLLGNHPPITIYDEDRKGYYAALESFHTSQDLKPLREFLESQTVKTWQKTLERTRTKKPPEQER